MITEKIVNTEEYAGTADLITGIDDFESKATFDDLFHTYRLNGKIIPSVTQLIDDGSYEGIPEEILETAQLKGTLVHKEIENYLNKGEIGFTKEFGDFLELYKKNKDLFNEKCIWDYKTYNYLTNEKKEKCFKQLKMYSKAIEYMTNEKIEKHRMIWLPHNKSGKIIDLD